MADINQIISLGIGTPADIPHFILVGLNPLSTVTAHPDGVGCTIGVGQGHATGTSGATGGWTGGDATPDYKEPSASWFTRQYVRQPGQRPRRRVKAVPEPPAPVVRQPLARVPYVPVPRMAPPPIVSHARGVGARVGVGRASTIVGVVARARAFSGIVTAHASSVKRPKGFTQTEWLAISVALADD